MCVKGFNSFLLKSRVGGQPIASAPALPCEICAASVSHHHADRLLLLSLDSDSLGSQNHVSCCGAKEGVGVAAALETSEKEAGPGPLERQSSTPFTWRPKGSSDQGHFARGEREGEGGAVKHKVLGQSDGKSTDKRI